MALKKNKVQGIWSSRWTFLAAATGLVVSLGNFWKAPQQLAANGGAVYLVAYLVFLLLVVLPVLGHATWHLYRRALYQPL